MKRSCTTTVLGSLGLVTLVGMVVLIPSRGQTAAAKPEKKGETVSAVKPAVSMMPKPDLVVTSIVRRGAPRVETSGTAEVVKVPLRVVVTNRGTVPATPLFKTSADFVRQGGGSYAVAFTVRGSRDIWCPWTTRPLAAGESVTFQGDLGFGPSDRHSTVVVSVVADSCMGDEFTPDYCRVQEGNETNNRSSSVSIALP
jgi:hypothetical protein